MDAMIMLCVVLFLAVLGLVGPFLIAGVHLLTAVIRLIVSAAEAIRSAGGDRE